MSASATFYGVLSVNEVDQEAQAASRNFAISDLANPPAAQLNGLGGGTRVVTSAGDFASQTGNDLLKKLVLRRLSTPPGGFFHLPGYGLGLAVKEPLQDADMFALKKRVTDQVQLEPEVQSAIVSLTIDMNNILTIQIAVTTTTGQNFSIETSAPLTVGS